MQELHCIDGYACESEERKGFCHREDHEKLLVVLKGMGVELVLEDSTCQIFYCFKWRL